MFLCEFGRFLLLKCRKALISTLQIRYESSVTLKAVLLQPYPNILFQKFSAVQNNL